MKRATILLTMILLLSCLLPVGGYYLVLAAQLQDSAAAVQQFLTDAAGSVPLPTAPPESAAPAGSAPSAGSVPPAGTEGLAADTVQVQDTATGQVLAVPMRDYILGAVASEMSMTWADAALQAQAVAVHSYVLYCRDHNDTASMGGAWLTADPARRQGFMTDAVLRSYWGTAYDENYARLSALVDAVLDTVVLYDSQPAATSYFALSNGRTEASQNVWGQALPYLQSVDSAGDRQAEGYTAQVTYTGQQMYDALVSNLGITPDGLAPGQYFGTPRYTDAGYIAEMEVCGVSVQGTVLRSALHLRSACFDIAYADGLFTITTYGYGHGVGLSQYGAQSMALAGAGWQEILQHYFPGTELAQVP